MHLRQKKKIWLKIRVIPAGKIVSGGSFMVTASIFERGAKLTIISFNSRLPPQAVCEMSLTGNR